MQTKTPKQYLQIAGKTVLEHSINAFINHPLVARVIVCLHPEDEAFSQLSIASHAKIKRVDGGEQRADSVLNGLSFLQNIDATGWVLVHDAARPGLSRCALNRLLAARETCTGAILALPIVDTVKLAKPADSFTSFSIAKTIDREGLWQAQTPQMFQVEALYAALSRALNDGIELTDEASAMEYTGAEVGLIEGELSNMKITRPEDLALAEFYLRQQTLKRETTW
jgi:2-C-methyl-D-erythritol 4-phosphate cytidylyltransferase